MQLLTCFLASSLGNQGAPDFTQPSLHIVSSSLLETHTVQPKWGPCSPPKASFFYTLLLYAMFLSMTSVTQPLYKSRKQCSMNPFLQCPPLEKLQQQCVWIPYGADLRALFCTFWVALSVPFHYWTGCQWWQGVVVERAWTWASGRRGLNFTPVTLSFVIPRESFRFFKPLCTH